MNKKWISILLLAFVIISSLACKQLFQSREGIDSSVVKLDANGNPILPRDSNGKPILPVSLGFYKTSAGETLPIPDGNYVGSDGKLLPIPNGYYTDNDGNLVPYLVDVTGSNKKTAKYGTDSQYHYSKDNLDLNYHSSVNEIVATTDAYGLVNGTAYVYDKNGKQVMMSPIGDVTNATYFVPGTYTYGAATYVPTYEDSVYLSQTSGASQVGIYKSIPGMNEGICSKYKNDPLALEEKCQTLTGDSCASTTCCVLLGGSKCVSGDSSGPTYKNNYSDVLISNKSYYYYNGNCYGNCAERDKPMPTLSIKERTSDFRPDVSPPPKYTGPAKADW